MKTNSSENGNRRWQKTPVANRVRHIQSRNYYVRIRMRGKLIWKSLKTHRISVARLRLGDFQRRASTRRPPAAARGKMTFGGALGACQEKLRNDPNIKPKTRPETGLKGRRVGETRIVPMIPEIIALVCTATQSRKKPQGWVKPGPLAKAKLPA